MKKGRETFRSLYLMLLIRAIVRTHTYFFSGLEAIYSNMFSPEIRWVAFAFIDLNIILDTFCLTINDM